MRASFELSYILAWKLEGSQKSAVSTTPEESVYLSFDRSPDTVHEHI